MLSEAPELLVYSVAGAFFLGWAVSRIGTWMQQWLQAKRRSDPRDDRIRSLEAELRVSKSDAENAKTALQQRDEQLDAEKKTVEQRDASLDEQLQIIETLRNDLRDSVRKTRELRTELADRATESVKSEARLRQVETELEVAHASTDMIATGVLDYSMAPDGEDEDEGKPRIVKAGN